jgi:hypothetical protein
MATIKIFKVRAWTINNTKKGNMADRIEDRIDEVFVGKKSLRYAKDRFKTLVKERKMEEMYGREVHIELFEPDVYNDGQLAYHPKNDIYIDRYVTN